VFRRDRPDAGNKFFALFAVGFGISLGGVERLFLRRKPSFRNRYQTCGKLSETPASRLNFCCTSASVTSGS
jgi:hypothetical protein